MRRSMAVGLALLVLLSASYASNATALQVIVMTEKPEYAPGELVLILGRGPPNIPAAVQVLDPSNATMVLLTAAADGAGMFSRSFRLPANADDGKYIVYASVPGFKAKSSFTVKAGAPSIVEGELKVFTLIAREWGFNGTSGGPAIRIQEGDRVRIVFINSGAKPHTWVLDAHSPSPYAVETESLKPNSSETVEFLASEVGEFTYYCSLPGHRAQGMEGNIIISGPTPTPTPTPTATPKPIPKPTPPPAEAKPTVIEGAGKVTLRVPSVDRGAKVELSFEKATDLSAKSLSITVKNPVKDIEIDIRKERQQPATVTKTVSGKVFEYFTIQERNITEADISEVKVQFKVDKAWITSNRIHVDTISLHRLTTQWDKLPTVKLGEDSQAVTFEATSPGLSVFAVSGKVKTTLSLAISAIQIDRGQAITASGRLDPAVQGATVHLTYVKAGGVEVKRQAPTDANGAFTDSFTPDAGGIWVVRALWDGNDDYVGASAQPVSFEVLDKGCLIATATFGSELSDEVQFLRGFRESTVYATFSGQTFMTTFNTFYYSFSPAVARGISSDQNVREVAKVALYPLLWSLQAATAASNIPLLNGEGAMVLVGFVASSLIGLAYLLPVMCAATVVPGNPRRRVAWAGLWRALLPVWIGNLTVLTFAIVTLNPTLAAVSTMIFVLSSMLLIASASLTGLLYALDSRR